MDEIARVPERLRHLNCDLDAKYPLDLLVEGDLARHRHIVGIGDRENAVQAFVSDLVQGGTGRARLGHQQPKSWQFDDLAVQSAGNREARLEAIVVLIVRQQLDDVAFSLRRRVRALARTPQIDNLHFLCPTR